MNTPYILIGIAVAINLFSLFLMARDKRLSTRGGLTDRTPEGVLFFVATCFGGIGIYAGMQLFRHKTKKWYFQLGIPLLMLQNAATLYLLHYFFSIY